MNLAFKPMTTESFLVWAQAQEQGRYELVDGQIIPMNAERVEHNEAKSAVLFALKIALAGTDCHVLGDGFNVTIDEHTAFEPDALVYRGERLPRGTVTFSTPIIVVEVLSPGTKTVDTTKKLEGYFKLPSLRHYLIVDPDTRAVVHHARDGAGNISRRAS